MKHPACGAGRRWIARGALAALAALLAGCHAVGPNYRRPPVETPPAWKEAPPPGWKNAAPNDAISKGDWWEVFGDPELNALETQAVASNPTLQAAVARVTQARAIAGIARSDRFPSIFLFPSASRARQSGNRPVSPPIVPAPYSANTFTLPLDASYEVDLWGRVRRSIESANAQVQASVADYENILLTLKADLAENYFLLRYVDADRAILRDNIGLQQRALELAQARHAGGVASGLDVSEAETLLATTQADYAGLERQRAQFEHAIAELVGRPASEFSLPEKPLTLSPPVIPIGLPSDLLERRPDIAGAERMMAAANAQIGVAKAAFFPSLALTGAGGYLSGDIVKLFNLPSAMWSVGADVAAPLFTGGRLSSNLERARAAYDESVANYRTSVLVAFREVEDAISALRVLQQQEVAYDKAVQSARQTADISTSRYRAGLANYLEVIDAERTVLANERLQDQVRELRLVTTVQLIQALGGGWAQSRIYISTAAPITTPAQTPASGPSAAPQRPQ
jgi:outer membrane protein, multidrug efflux system